MEHATFRVVLDLLMRGGHGGEREAARADGVPVIEPERPLARDARALGDELAVRLRGDDLDVRPRRHERPQRVRVEVVGVGVRRGDDVDEAQPFGLDDQLGHPLVRLVGVRVLARQRVREIRVQQQVPALPGDQEPGLADPPQVEQTGRAVGGSHVVQELLARLQRPDHASRYRTPVSSSETSHSRRATASSCAAFEADTSRGLPARSKRPSGPT